MSTYKVCGLLNYRDHKPGTTFIATLGHAEEQRALERGNISIIQHGPVCIEDARVRPPKGN